MSTQTVEGPAIPRMGAETGYDLDDSQSPVRFSGFVCLLIGLLSSLSMLGRPLLLVPLAAILFGLIALRPSIEGIPVGTMAAKIGLFFAVGFGACGFFLPWNNERTLGGQAEYFVHQFIDALANEEWELVSELQKSYKARALASMPIKEFYASNESASQALEEMQTNNDVLKLIGSTADETDWQLESTPRVFTRWGRQMVDTLWVDRNGVNSQKLQVELEYEVDPKNDMGEWHITLFQFHRERLVAESIL